MAAKNTSNDALPASYSLIEHVEVRTKLPYAAAIAAFERELGRLDEAATLNLVKRKAPWAEVKRAIGDMAGPRGLMIIYRADQGAITSLSGVPKRCTLYVVGNPVIANDIIGIDPRAAFYVPFRVAIFEADGAPGAMMGYDRPSSFLGTLKRTELEPYGQQLDGKIDSVARDLCAGE